MKAKTKNTLKRIGHYDLYFIEIKLSVLLELKMLLSPFKIFIDILSSNLPTLPIVPLMKKKIRNMCTAGTNDSKDISKVKNVF